MNINAYKVVLASNSPRRRELLKQVGLQFDVIPSQCEEIIREKEPQKVVMQLSYDKAKDIVNQTEYNTIIIGADTVVAVNGNILGKPKDKKDAFNMITALKNHYHSVYTGVTIIFHSQNGDIVRNFACETKVYVYDMTDEEINNYIESGEPMDKAGAYGIQGRFAEFVQKIEGDYNNVVGLPVSALLYEIKQMEVE